MINEFPWKYVQVMDGKKVSHEIRLKFPESLDQRMYQSISLSIYISINRAWRRGVI